MESKELEVQTDEDGKCASRKSTLVLDCFYGPDLLRGKRDGER